MPRRNHRHNGNRRRRRNGLSKVKKDIKWLKQNIEFKFIDTQSDAATDNTGDITVFNNNIAAGPDVDERSGEEITSRRIFIRGFIHNDRGTPADGTMRLILFRQNASLVSLPSVNEILDSSGTIATNRMRNMDNKEDIVVYADHTVAYDTLAHTLIPFKFMFKLNHQVKYTVPTVVVPQWNTIALLAISSQATTANAPGVALTARYSYVDS